MVAVALVRRRRSTVRREPCLPEDPSQVDDHLLVDVFPTRALEHFGLGAQSDFEFAVALLCRGSDVLQQLQNLPPLDIAAGRMTETVLDRVAMMTTEVLAHSRSFRVKFPSTPQEA